MRFDFPAAFESSFGEVLFFAIVFACFVAAIVYSVVRHRTHRQALERHGRKQHRAQLGLDDSGLSPRLEEIVERLSWLAPSDEIGRAVRDDPQNHGRVIRRLARRGLRDGAVSLREASDLLHALGEDASLLASRPSSASALPPGTAVSVADAWGTIVQGAVEESTTNALRLSVEEKTGDIEAGAPVEVVGYQSAYLTTFSTVTRSKVGRTLDLDAVEGVQVAQRRRYNRSPVRIPVRMYDRSNTSEELSTRTYEMSAGGMSVRNPRRKLEPGDTLECELESTGRPVRVVARVTDTSRKGAIAHLEFQADDASTRHRVLELLFTRKRRSA